MSGKERKKLIRTTRLTVFSLIYNWMIEGMPSEFGPCDKDEVYELMDKIKPQKERSTK